MVSWTYWWICWAHYFRGWNKNWLQRWNKIFNLSRRITEAAWRESKIIGLEWTFLVNSGVSWVLWKVDAKSESGAQKSDWQVTLVKGEGRKQNQTDTVLRLYLGHMMPLLWMTQIIKEQIFLAALQDSQSVDCTLEEASTGQTRLSPGTTVLLSHWLGLLCKELDLGSKARVDWTS